jgi:hypothetical protein
MEGNDYFGVVILGGILVWALHGSDNIMEVTVYDVRCSAYNVEVTDCKSPNRLRSYEMEMKVLVREQYVANPEHSLSYQYRCQVWGREHWECISDQEEPNVIRMSDGEYFNREIDARADGRTLRFTRTGYLAALLHRYTNLSGEYSPF